MKVRANGVEIEVEVHGPADGEPLLLIMGLGMQLVGWHDGLVEQFVAQGFRVIRFDNRDVGLSQGFDELGMPNLALAATSSSSARPGKNDIHGASLSWRWPSKIMRPQLTAFWSPRPRKLRPASVRIARPIRIVASVTIGEPEIRLSASPISSVTDHSRWRMTS